MLHLREDITDVVPRVSVQALFEPFLIEEVSNEANTSTKDKETIESSVLDDILSFIFGEEITKTFNKMNIFFAWED